MKVGIKMYPDHIHLIPEYFKFADYIEIMATKDLKPPKIKNTKTPITIHAQHIKFGVNPANPSKEKFNLKAIKIAQKAADTVNSDIIVLHPGYYENKKCNLQTAIDFHKKLDDKRIIFENLSLPEDLCRTVEDVKHFKKETKTNFCFDFGHATVIARQEKKNYKRYIRQFVKLKPAYFHISDGLITDKKDSHLNLGKGNYDLKFMKQFIKNKRVTLEVNHKSSIECFKNQVEYMKYGTRLKRL